MHFDRVVVGGGLFGAYAAIILSELGFTVCLIEQDDKLLNRASYVNQARLHTGLHYPRSLLTAKETLIHYKNFREKYPTAVREFEQIYAISRYGSKTNGNEFREFIRRLGITAHEISPEIYFNSASISNAFSVEEPTFDADELRKIFEKRISSNPKIKVLLGKRVTGGDLTQNSTKVCLESGLEIKSDALVIATYAGINSLRKSLGLDLLPLTYEIADVFLGTVAPQFKNLGFTIMDGPFWSLMPFGQSALSSLTSVGLTPIARSKGLPIFDCQDKHAECSSNSLQVCTGCEFRPPSNFDHILKQVSLHLKSGEFFQSKHRLTTIKTILSTSEVDDARPTVIRKEKEVPVWTIFSGKVTTLFDIQEALN